MRIIFGIPSDVVIGIIFCLVYFLWPQASKPRKRNGKRNCNKKKCGEKKRQRKQRGLEPGKIEIIRFNGSTAYINKFKHASFIACRQRERARERKKKINAIATEYINNKTDSPNVHNKWEEKCPHGEHLMENEPKQNIKKRGKIEYCVCVEKPKTDR